MVSNIAVKGPTKNLSFIGLMFLGVFVSFVSECLHWMDSRRPARRQPAGQQGHRQKKQRNGNEGQRIAWFDLEKEGAHNSRESESATKAERYAYDGQRCSLANY